MKKITRAFGALAVAAFGFGLAAATAQDAGLAGGDTATTLTPTPAKYVLASQPAYEDAVQQLSTQGFEVMSFEKDGRHIEVKGLTATGHCFEVKFNAQTGKEVRREREDDCFGG